MLFHTFPSSLSELLAQSSISHKLIDTRCEVA